MLTIRSAPRLKVPSTTWWTPTYRTAARPIAVTTPTIRLYTPPATRTFRAAAAVASYRDRNSLLSRSSWPNAFTTRAALSDSCVADIASLSEDLTFRHPIRIRRL